MKITDVQVDGFGVWNGLSVGELSDRMTVFFGHNEAGKTTLMQFVRSVLYGFSSDRRRRYLPPVHGGLPGGSLYVTSHAGDLEIQRHLDLESENGSGTIALTSSAGDVQGQSLLDTVLAGVDEPIFNNVFAIGLRELQELGSLDDTDAADQLYKLTSGLDRVSLVDVMRHLNTARERLVSSEGRKSRIDDLLAQRERLRGEIESLSAQSASWARAAGERGSLEKDVTALEREIDETERRARRVEIAVLVREPWQQRAALDHQLASIGSLPDLDDEAIDRLNRLNAAIKKRRGRLQQFKYERAALRDQGAAIPINRQLWSQAARIEALNEQSGWLTSLEGQIQRLTAEVGISQSDLDAKCEQLGLAPDVISNDLPEVSRRMLSKLRVPARKISEQTKRLAAARRERDAARGEADALKEKLRSELAEHGHAELSEALEQSGEVVTKLRRRLQMEQRIDKMSRDREELQEDIDELLDRQVLPVWVLVALGGFFVLGVMLIFGGLFLWSWMGGLGWAIALLGLGGWGVTVATKFLLERNARRELKECEDQLDRLREQLKKAKAERDQLDAELPTGGGQLDSRLEEAESKLGALEELLPLDNGRQTAQQRFEAASQRANKAAEELRDGRRMWKKALRGVGLPEELTPKNVREMSNRCEQIAEARLQLRSRREELQERQGEYDAVCGRLQDLSSHAGIEPADGDPHHTLRVLSAALGEQQHLVDRRRSLVRDYRQLRRKQSKLRRATAKLQRLRHNLLVEAGVSHEADFRRLAEQIQQARSLRGQRDELTRQIQSSLHERCSEDEVARQFETGSPAALDSLWDEMQMQLELSREQLSEMHTRRGELAQEMKSLEQDRRIAEAQLQLGGVEQRLRDAVGRLQVLAVTSRLLDEIREIYETERQPETLKEASGFLEKLTDGQYQRIWTPMSDNVLLVDNADEESLPVEVLSRGTREAVFLSLRLALVSLYARRGAVLPLILDDVLVNLDAARAKAAARLLRDFAKSGHQLLLFTCHEHIMKMFKTLKVEIRQLPNHTELAAAEVEEEDEVEQHVEYEQEEDEPEEVYAEVEEEVEEEEVIEPQAEQLEEAAKVEAEEDADLKDESIELWEEEVYEQEAAPDEVVEVKTEIEEVFVPEPSNQEPPTAWAPPEAWWEEETDEAA